MLHRPVPHLLLFGSPFARTANQVLLSRRPCCRPPSVRGGVRGVLKENDLAALVEPGTSSDSWVARPNLTLLPPVLLRLGGGGGLTMAYLWVAANLNSRKGPEKSSEERANGKVCLSTVCFLRVFSLDGTVALHTALTGSGRNTL